MATIRIDDEVYTWLKLQAIPFEDTPNSVLRRLAGLDRKSTIKAEVPVHDISSKEIKEEKQMDAVKEGISYSKSLNGKLLARLWKVDVVHALYHQDGKWYNHLRDFPGALFDPNGYVIFNTEREYKESPYLQHGMELHVPEGIYSMPGYKRMK
jgi:hypothetical protein